MDTATPDGSKFSLPHQLMFPDAHSSSGHLTAGRNLLGGAYGGPSSGPSHQQMLLDYEEASPSRHGPSHRREWKPLMGMIRIFAGNGRGDGGVYAAATLTALARSVHSILCQIELPDLDWPETDQESMIGVVSPCSTPPTKAAFAPRYPGGASDCFVNT